jgi:hypothetical protein
MSTDWPVVAAVVAAVAAESGEHCELVRFKISSSSAAQLLNSSSSSCCSSSNCSSSSAAAATALADKRAVMWTNYSSARVSTAHKANSLCDSRSVRITTVYCLQGVRACVCV